MFMCIYIYVYIYIYILPVTAGLMVHLREYIPRVRTKQHLPDVRTWPKHRHDATKHVPSTWKVLFGAKNLKMFFGGKTRKRFSDVIHK